MAIHQGLEALEEILDQGPAGRNGGRGLGQPGLQGRRRGPARHRWQDGFQGGRHGHGQEVHGCLELGAVRQGHGGGGGSGRGADDGCLALGRDAGRLGRLGRWKLRNGDGGSLNGGGG